jgi:hypothetical protein
MSVSLATLVARLTAAVAARNGVPSTAQYGQCVEDAVADLGARKPNQKTATLSVVSGTAAYALPSDFVRMISLVSLAATADGSVLITGAGLIPMGADWEETYTIAGTTITFSPTPAYSMARTIWYAAGHVLDSNSAYPDLTAAETRLVLLKAQANALGLQANAAAGTGWKYSIGDESVDKTGIGKGMMAQAQMFEEQYERALRGAAGAFGVRG